MYDNIGIDSWKQILNDICSNPEVIEEYRKAFLLNLFQKVCSKMEKDIDYKKKINKLFLQSFSKVETTKKIVNQNASILLSDEDAKIISDWFDAYRKKSGTRKIISATIKKDLFKKQEGLCAVCGNELGNDWSKIHVDHIIPWKLVGDELDNNYQLLCGTCNECKSAKTDYLFKNLINLI